MKHLLISILTCALLTSCHMFQSSSDGGSSDSLANVLDADYDVSKLKEAIESLPTEEVQGLADQLLEAVQTQDGVVNQLKSLGNKTQLDSAMKQLDELKGKLQVVVDKLKAGGVDVSKYTAMLG